MLLEALSKSYSTLLHSAAHTHMHTQLHINVYALIQMVAHKDRYTYTQTKRQARTWNTQTSTCTLTNTMAQRLLLKIWDFFPSPSFLSVEPCGEWEEKKCCRGAGYLHIYSSGFISLPADSTAREHQMVGRLCLLFSATGFSQPEVLRSQRLPQVYGEITLTRRLEKYIWKDVEPTGFVEWAEVDHTMYVTKQKHLVLLVFIL